MESEKELLMPDLEKSEFNLEEAEAIEIELEEYDFSADETFNTSLLLQRAKETPLYSKEEEEGIFKALTNAQKNKDKEKVCFCKDQIFIHNILLIGKIASKYVQYAKLLDYEDLFQEGIIGLHTAIKKYDYTLGYKFSTYAMWWIRQSIVRALYNTDDSIRIPIHVRNKILKYNEMTPEEKVDYEKKVKFDIKNVIYNTRVSSLNEPVNSDDNDYMEVGDLISNVVDYNAPFINEDLKKILMEFLDEYIDSLGLYKNRTIICKKERTRVIVCKKFGLNGYEQMSLEEIGIEYGFTRERARQIVEGFISFCRHPHRLAVLQEFLVS